MLAPGVLPLAPDVCPKCLLELYIRCVYARFLCQVLVSELGSRDVLQRAGSRDGVLGTDPEAGLGHGFSILAPRIDSRAS